MNGVAIYLPVEDWNRVLAVLAQAPWNIANPLIMAMGEQLRMRQENGPPNTTEQPRGNGVDRDPPS